MGLKLVETSLPLDARKVDSSDKGVAVAAASKGWQSYCRALERSGLQLLRRVAEHPATDGHDVAEGVRYLTRLVRGGITGFVEGLTKDPPQLESLGTGIKLGADNPQNHYRFVALDDGQSYVLRGVMSEVPAYWSLGLYRGLSLGGEKAGCTTLLQASDLVRDPADGAFAIVITTGEPDRSMRGVTWMQRAPGATERLVWRETLLPDQVGVADVSLSYATAGESIPVRLPAAVSEDAVAQRAFARLPLHRVLDGLANAELFTAGSSFNFLNWTESFAQRPNSLEELDEVVGASSWADPNLRIYHGYFAFPPPVTEDSALLLTLAPPADCAFWNVQLDDYFMESLDHEQGQACIVDGTSGCTRILVARRQVPAAALRARGVAWLDARDRHHGTWAYRLVYPERPTRPIVTTVSLKAFLAKELDP